MTFAWYAHLKHLGQRPWIVAALVSWGIALFEYLLQVPANRIGYTVMTLPQLKILQEVITLTVFVPFVICVHAPAVEARLPVGGVVHGRRGLLHFPQISSTHAQHDHRHSSDGGACRAGDPA